jgi:transposase
MPKKETAGHTVCFGTQRHADTFVVCKADGRKSSERRRYIQEDNIRMDVTSTVHDDVDLNSLAHVMVNPLSPELNPICYLLALLRAHHFLHVSRIRVKSLTLRLLMSYIYEAPILDVSRPHTTTRHSR